MFCYERVVMANAKMKLMLLVMGIFTMEHGMKEKTVKNYTTHRLKKIHISISKWKDDYTGGSRSCLLCKVGKKLTKEKW